MLKWPPQFQPLTASGLQRALASPRVVGIHCWASWNGHDHAFVLGLSLTAERFKSTVDFYALDVQDSLNLDVIAEWGIPNVPAFVVFRQGVRLSRIWMELESTDEFRQRVEDWIVTALDKTAAAQNAAE